MDNFRKYWWLTTLKLATKHIAQKDFQKSWKEKCEYATVDGFLDSGSDNFRIGGYSWVIESLTQIKVTVFGYC